MDRASPASSHAHPRRGLGELEPASLHIPPHLYDLWLDSLMQAVRECDRLWAPETERVWRRMMEQGIAETKARHDPDARPS